MSLVRRIVLVSRPLLLERYGREGTNAILAEALECAGNDPSLLVISYASDAPGLRADLLPVLEKHSGEELPILLLGGPSTLPFFSVPNPVWLVREATGGLHEDPSAPYVRVEVDEPFIDSDNPYGVLDDLSALGNDLSSSQVAEQTLRRPRMTDEGYEALRRLLLPRWALGRIPDCPGMSATQYVTLIRKLCGASPTWDDPSRSFVLSTWYWSSTTRKITRILGFPKCLESPTLKLQDFESPPGAIPGHTCQLLFNVHGSDRHRHWFGGTGRSPPEEVFSPIAAQLVPATEGLVVSQGCFGAHLTIVPEQKDEEERLRTLDESISMSFLQGSAAAFLGSTSVAYGMHNGTLGSSDVLAHEFFKAAMRGSALGQALRHARHALSQQFSRLLPHNAYKALLQFVLYGDPSVHSKAKREDKDFEQAEPLTPQDIPRIEQWVSVGLPTSVARHGKDGWRQVAQLQSPCAGSTAVLQVFLRKSRLGDEDIMQFRLRLKTPDGTVREEESGGGISVRRLESRWFQSVAPDVPSFEPQASLVSHLVEAPLVWLYVGGMVARQFIAVPLWQALRQRLSPVSHWALSFRHRRRGLLHKEWPGGRVHASRGGVGLQQAREQGFPHPL